MVVLMARSGVGIAMSPVLARLPLNDGARHPGKHAHAASAQDCVPIQDSNKKPSPGQGDQETCPCPELGPEPVMPMGLITICTGFCVDVLQKRSQVCPLRVGKLL